MVRYELPLGKETVISDAACSSFKGKCRMEQKHKCYHGTANDRKGTHRL